MGAIIFFSSVIQINVNHVIWACGDPIKPRREHDGAGDDPWVYMPRWLLDGHLPQASGYIGKWL